MGANAFAHPQGHFGDHTVKRGAQMATLESLLGQQQLDALSFFAGLDRFALGTHRAQGYFFVFGLFARYATAEQQGRQCGHLGGQGFFFLAQLFQLGHVLQLQAPALHLQLLQGFVQVHQHLPFADPAALAHQHAIDAPSHGHAELDISQGLRHPGCARAGGGGRCRIGQWGGRCWGGLGCGCFALCGRRSLRP